MNDYRPSTYGEQIAEVYDQLYPGVEAAALDLIVEFAKGGRALELGVGTGRFAIPLSQRGVPITGVDASEAMLTKLRAKPGSEAIETHLADFSDFSLGKKYKLVYIPFNTIFAALTQRSQIQLFSCAAAHLEPQGCFLVEAFVPDLSRFTRGQNLTLLDADGGGVHIDATQLDSTNQILTGQHIFLSEKGARLYPVKLRFAYPPELDLMARLAGLTLKNRWGGWDKREFTAESSKHISTYSLESA